MYLLSQERHRIRQLTENVANSEKVQHSVISRSNTAGNPHKPNSCVVAFTFLSKQGFNFWSIQDHPWDYSLLIKGEGCKLHYRSTWQGVSHKQLDAAYMTLVSCLPLCIVVYYREKNAVDNFHLIGTFNFSVMFTSYVHECGLLLYLNKVSRSYQELNGLIT